MNHPSAHSGVVPHGWLQHHLPWLGLFALVLSLFRDDEALRFGPDERNG